MGIVLARSFHNQTERTPLHAARQTRHAADAEPPMSCPTWHTRVSPLGGQAQSAKAVAQRLSTRYLMPWISTTPSRPQQGTFSGWPTGADRNGLHAQLRPHSGSILAALVPHA